MKTAVLKGVGKDCDWLRHVFQDSNESVGIDDYRQEMVDKNSACTLQSSC